MTKLVVGTDNTESSDAIIDYLSSVVEPEDTLYIVNSLSGGDDTSSEDVRDGKKAIETIEDGLEGIAADVETHQFVRGNEPVEDLLIFADDVNADEFVVGMRKRTPVGKVVFGSTGQNLLLGAERTVRCVPLVD